MTVIAKKCLSLPSRERVVIRMPSTKEAGSCFKKGIEMVILILR